MTHRLEIKLLNYFLLIALAAIMIGIEFFFEMGQSDLKDRICEIAPQQSNTVITSSDNSSPVITSLRNKIVIMFALLTLVVAIVMSMFIKNITIPLQRMVNAAQHINQGDLSHVIEVNTQDEIGLVGQAINDLTSNLQECASFTCITARETLEIVNNLNRSLTSELHIDNDSLQEIESRLSSLIEFADSFQLLHTDVKDNA